MSTLTEYEKRVSKIDDSLLLGHLSWYTVHSDLCVSHSDVVKGLVKVGLSSYLPPAPRNFDVFRRITSNAQLKKVPTGQDGVFNNYMIREVDGRGETIITRRIVVERVDRNGKKLSYSQLRDIFFNRDTAKIEWKDLELHSDPAVVSITDNIVTEFAAWKGMLNAYAVREFVRRMLLNFGATLVRPGGGVYFVHKSKSDKITALETFVNDISPSASFHSLPLVDDRKQREMVQKAFESETSDEIDEILAEIATMKSQKRRISIDRYAAMVARYQELMDRTKEYSGILDNALGEVHSRLVLFQSAVVGLRHRVKED